MSTALDALTGWVLFAGLSLAIGAVAGRWAILPRVTAAAPPPAGRRRAAALGLIGAVLTLLGVALYLARQLLEFRDPFVPWTQDAGLLLGTSWGDSWKAAGVSALVLVGAMAGARRGRRWGWWIASPVALGLAAFPGFTGHAAGADAGRWLALLADWAHVSAAGVWIGGLAVVLWVSRPGVPDRADLAELVPAFSPLAMAGAGSLIVTGTYAAWQHVPSLASLATTSYGRMLLAKLVLVAVVLSFGARNFRVLTPGLGTPGGARSMRRSAAVELLVAQLVLLVTALLVRTPPMDP